MTATSPPQTQPARGRARRLWETVRTGRRHIHQLRWCVLVGLLLWFSVVGLPAMMLSWWGRSFSVVHVVMLALPVWMLAWSSFEGSPMSLLWGHLLSYVPALIACPALLRSPLHDLVHSACAASLLLGFVGACVAHERQGRGLRSMVKLLRWSPSQWLGLCWLAMAWCDDARLSMRLMAVLAGWLSVLLLPLTRRRGGPRERRWSLWIAAVLALLWWRVL